MCAPDQNRSALDVHAIYLITLITLVVQGCHQGSRVVASLFAIELGADPFLIGALISAYSLFPLLLGVYSGRVSDRFGFTAAYLCFAALTLLPAGLLAGTRRLDVAPRAGSPGQKSTLELLHNAPLRRAMITSALVVTGWDLLRS